MPQTTDRPKRSIARVASRIREAVQTAQPTKLADGAFNKALLAVILLLVNQGIDRAKLQTEDLGAQTSFARAQLSVLSKDVGQLQSDVDEIRTTTQGIRALIPQQIGKVERRVDRLEKLAQLRGTAAPALP